MIATALLLASAISGTPAACVQGSTATAAFVEVHGFKDRIGNLRVIIYNANEEEFLVEGKYVQRIDTPVPPSGSMKVCAPLPKPGKYVVVALHDRDANGKFGPFKDGVGFARNPKLGLSKPKVERVETDIQGVANYAIVLNYMQGLSVRPVKSPRNP